MGRYICSNCKSNFYANEDDDFEVGENFYCSYCYPKVKMCSVCGKLKLFKRKINTDYGVCEECKGKSQFFPNTWLTLRFKVFERDNFTCGYCGRSPLKDKDVVLHCDHIYPVSKGGETVLDNLLTACSECNIGKIDIVLDKYKIDLLKSRIK